MTELSFSQKNFKANSSQTNINTADLNGDGNLDLVTGSAEWGKNLAVLLGDGKGSFGKAKKFSSGGPYSFPTAVAVGDLDRNGNQDIVSLIANPPTSGNYVSAMLGDGKGGFGKAKGFRGSAGAYSGQSVALADFNGDGFLDLVNATSYRDTSVAVLLGSGKGGFGSPTDFNTKAKYGSSSVAAADFNGDGNEDIVAGANSGNTVSLLLGDGAGNFREAKIYKTSSNRIYQVVTADLNGDGNPDVVAATNKGVAVLLGSKDGSLKKAKTYKVNRYSTYARSVAVADFDGDGFDDIVAASSGGTISVLSGKGDGSFSTGQEIQNGIGINTGGIVAADFNGDGRTDLAAANSSNSEVALLLNNTIPTVNVTEGGDNNDKLDGTKLGDRIEGRGGDDVIDGREGDDTLIGGANNDKLTGNVGNDSLLGEDGNDRLWGGAGKDTLIGGAGKDEFVFGSGDPFALDGMGLDRVADFKAGDIIVLELDTFVTLKSNEGKGFSIKREFASVKNDAAVDRSSADIVFSQSSGGLFYNANGSMEGFGGGGQFATLEDVSKLSANNFLLE